MFVEIVILWLPRYKTAWTSLCAENRWTSYFYLLYILLLNFYLKLCRKLHYNLGALSHYSPGGGTVVAFCGRILALSRWNLQISRCKCPGVLRGQPRGIAADKCISSDNLPVKHDSSWFLPMLHQPRSQDLYPGLGKGPGNEVDVTWTMRKTFVESPPGAWSSTNWHSVRESLFNMTRGGDEDIEGGLRKFLDIRKWGYENLYTSKPTGRGARKKMNR